MHISALFRTIARGSNPQPLAVDEYEFTIDRSAGRIVSPLNFLSARETIRVQTNRPFTWNGHAELPDTSLGRVRTIRCNIELSGTLPGSEAKTREFLALLLRNQYNIDHFFSRSLNQTITEQRIRLGGAIVDGFRTQTDTIQTAMAASLRAAGLPIEQVDIRLISYDHRQSLDLVDEGSGIAIRTRGSLEAHRVTYKARMVWGPRPDHLIARLAYDGSIEGQTPGPTLARPLVAGQIQPLEAFFRLLLEAALAHETFNSIVSGEAAMLERVKALISGPLGAGTGRVVDTLVIYPVLTNRPMQAERSAQFRSQYTIMGIRGDRLEIEHAIRFALVDRDRWLSQNSPDPETFLRQQIIDATRVFLHDKRFEHIVGLYLGPDGERNLGNAVATRVAPIAATIGFRLVSIAAILAIPEHDFIEGSEIALPEQTYQLADPYLQPLMRLKVTVKVVDGAVFARALARQEDFKGQIRVAIEQTLRANLRGRTALDYYGSPYVNGIALPSTGDAASWRNAAPESDPFTSGLRDSLGIMLHERFGLIVTHFDLEPGDDPIITRMQGLTNLPVRHEETLLFKRGNLATTIRMDASATLFITGLAPEYWSSFYTSVPRYTSTNEHVDEIRGMLSQTLRMLEHALVANDRTGLQSAVIHREVVGRFTTRLAQEYGLTARLRPLQLSVYRPKADQTASLVVEELHEELKLLLARRRNLQDTTSYDSDDVRERLTRRIGLVRTEMADESRRREQEIEESETVQVHQDLITGEIEAQREALPEPGTPKASEENQD